jgi:hypothetical protein
VVEEFERNNCWLCEGLVVVIGERREPGGCLKEEVERALNELKN